MCDNFFLLKDGAWMSKFYWKVRGSGYWDETTKFEYAIDGNTDTFWHVEYGALYPFIEVQLSRSYNVTGGQITCRKGTEYRAIYMEVK
jgi:hypothetical protein